MNHDPEQVLANVLVERRDSPSGGSGLFAKTAFTKGDLICGYRGRPVDNEERRRMRERRDPACFYVMNCDGVQIVPEDLTSLGGHLANHSCDPNADFEAWPEHPNTCVLRAARRIAAGEEIRLYYAWTSLEECPCRCGSRRCTGSIGLRLHEGEDGSLRCREADIVRLLQVGYANRNKHCRMPLHRLRTFSDRLASDEAWAAQLDVWLGAAFGSKWKKSPVFRWFFS